MGHQKPFTFLLYCLAAVHFVVTQRQKTAAIGPA